MSGRAKPLAALFAALLSLVALVSFSRRRFGARGDAAARVAEPGTHRVVVVGGGFGGLNAVRALASAPVHVTLIDKRNFHLFQPLLYQVATAALSPGEIASPLRLVFSRQKNTSVLLAEVTGIDVAGRRVLLSDGDVPYDTLVLATGSSHSYFGHQEWEQFAPGLKTIEDALEIRRRMLLAYEAAERETNPERRAAWQTFVVVGAGPTGVELAGAISEIARYTLRGNFRHIDPSESRVLLIEGADRALPPYPPDLSAAAQRQLEGLGVTVRLNTLVTAIDAGSVTVEGGGVREVIPARTVLWAAGVQASPLGRALCQQVGCQTDKAGRVIVEPDLTVPGHPEIFVIGDMAHLPGKDGNPLPGLAPVATQQGRYVAGSIGGRLRGEKPAAPFSYFDKGTMAVIGRHEAVVNVGRFRFGGITAWLMWLFIHLILLINFESRLVVLVRWAFSYFTHNRGSRVLLAMGTLRLPITGAESRKQPFEQG
jgi:NADH dehydrogenase